MLLRSIKKLKARPIIFQTHGAHEEKYRESLDQSTTYQAWGVGSARAGSDSPSKAQLQSQTARRRTHYRA